MRSYSFFSIVLLCFGIVVLDTVTFYWLQSITNLLDNEGLKTVVHVLFWFFTIGLVSAILILKIRLNNIHPMRRHLFISRFYGLVVSSFMPKLIFVIVISVAYFANLMFSNETSLVLVPLIGLFSGFLPFFIILYAVFNAVYHFKLYHQKIRFPNLPDVLKGFKIVQISDLHLGNFNFRYSILERAVALINNQNADIICFTGDLVNNYSWELRGWENVLSKLKAKQGKFAVLGNHDYGDYSQWKSAEEKRKNFEVIKKFFSKIGFTLLLNESNSIKQHSKALTILGVENWGHPPFKQYGNLEEALRNVDVTSFKILLSHDPSHWDAEVVDSTDINLTLSGHTHGMQAGITIGNKQWSPIKYKFKQWAGLYRKGSQYLYVNRGLGWLGFPGRLGMRPEITVLELYNI